MPQSITRVEGPPGSGKSRFLAREAIRLHIQEGIPAADILLLAVSGANLKRLKRYLKMEAALAGLEVTPSIQAMILDDWLLALLNQGQPDEKQWHLLSELQTRLILGDLGRRAVSVDDPLRHAARQPSFSRLLSDFIRQCQLQRLSPDNMKAGSSDDSRLSLLAKVYSNFLAQCEQARLLTHPALIQRVLQIGDDTSTSWPSVVLIDEAQELSEAHYQFLEVLPSSLVLAGNEKLGIRSYRGGNPELFQTFFQNRPVSVQVQQACMRHNPAILTLLNGLLPQPIWEAQTPELEQLQSLVRIGTHADPAGEAAALATAIRLFVSEGRVGDRLAGYADCVVLLRSAHYKQHLQEAFERNGIPFHDEALSTEVFSVRRGFFDLLNVLSGWEDLGLAERHFEAPSRLWDAPPLKNSEKAALYQSNNWSLTRWLEAVLSQNEQGMALRYLRTAESEEVLWVLPGWLDEVMAPPPLLTALRQLQAFYIDWLEHQDPAVLFRLSAQALTSPAVPGEEAFLSVPELVAFQELLAQLAERYRRATGASIGLATILAEYAALWEGLNVPAVEGKAGVRIRSIHQIQGEEFPWVAIPFLNSEEFPYRRDLSELLSPEVQDSLGGIFNSQFEVAEEARLLAVGMSRATHRLVLSCHRAEEGTDSLRTVLPSEFFVTLYTERQRLLGHADLLEVVAQVESQTTADESSETATGQYQGKSVWAKLEAQADEPIFPPDFELITSPTAIGAYMRCPRQYYYKHLLKLPEGGTAAASLGTLVHKVMEVFNSQTPPGGFTKERLADLAEALFTFDSEPDRFVMAGYGEQEKRELSQMSSLALSSLRIRLLASIEDLSEKGYFDRYASLKAVQAEKELRDVAIEGIERCRFKGKMDAVIQLADGNWEVVDYKTYGQSKYAAKWEVCEGNFRKILEPLPDDEGLSHQERFAGKMSSSYPVDYQLPLYYLACKQDAAYQGKLEGISLQLVRPQFPENPQQGAIRLGISAEELDAHKARLTQDIQNYIVDPILGSSRFPAMPATNACDYCAYAGICEGAQADDEWGSEG